VPPRWILLLAAPLLACSNDPSEATPPTRLTFQAVTFNTGTAGMTAPDKGGLTKEQATIQDEHYGNGLAYPPVIEDTRRFFARESPDVVALQEVFFSGRCPEIPAASHEPFVCAAYRQGDPTVAQLILGPDYQVACHQETPDKCVAVHRRFGRFAGCAADLCLDGVVGRKVDGCGSSVRVGRAVIELTSGGTLTVVHVHGTSGFKASDVDCRVQQIARVFDDLGLGDGPAIQGERNLILGDFNTDPGRMDEASAQAWRERVGEGKAFRFVSPVGPEATPSYAGLFNIDHAASDAFEGACVIVGASEGTEPVTEIPYFDHKPLVCTLTERLQGRLGPLAHRELGQAPGLDPLPEHPLHLLAEDDAHGLHAHGSQLLDHPRELLLPLGGEQRLPRVLDEVLCQLGGGLAQVPPENLLRLRRRLDVDPHGLELEAHRQQRRAPDEVSVAMALDGPGTHQVRQEPHAGVLCQLQDLSLGHGAGLVVGPGGLELRLQPEPLAHIHLATIDAGEQLPDGVDPQPPILELGDELEPLQVGVAVVRHPPPDGGRVERPLRLVVADRPARDAGDRGEVVDGVLLRLGLLRSRFALWLRRHRGPRYHAPAPPGILPAGPQTAVAQEPASWGLSSAPPPTASNTRAPSGENPMATSGAPAGSRS
jgi:hypothetical protein